MEAGTSTTTNRNTTDIIIADCHYRGVSGMKRESHEKVQDHAAIHQVLSTTSFANSSPSRPLLLFALSLSHGACTCVLKMI